MSLHAAVAGWLLGAPSGANRRLLALLAHLGPRLRDGERVTVLHGLPDEEVPNVPGIEWRRIAIAAGSTWRRWRDERRTLAPTLRSLGATLLDHGFLPLPRVEVPTVWTLHDLRGPAGLTRWPRAIAAAAVRRAARRAHTTIVPSEFTRRELLRLVPDARCVVIANGVDLPPAEPQPTSSASTPTVLHVGHLEPRKNLAVLLQALALLPAAARPGLRLIGHDAGDGPRLRALAARLGLADAVAFGGAVDDASLAREYAAATVVAVPSHYEGFGLAALEGLAFGKRVLVADAGALPEVVGASAERLPPDDAAAWARAFATLRPATAAEAAARRAHAARFAWSDGADRLLAVWRAVGAISAASR
jgi:glycosyltransferase involved in cell wall biosynthesis